MRSFQILWQVILADFRERTRRYSYLITLMVALFVGYLVLTGKYSFLFGPFRPVYNSPWIGTTVALTGAAMFTIMGFYIVRTSISRDRQTRVGDILAATRLSNVSYLLAKFVSNLLVLWSMVAALTLTALVGMVANLPFAQINLGAFILPFLLLPMVITIPVAAAAVLFDTARWLRGTIGNVIYFFFAEFMIVTGIFKMPYFDAVGMGLLESSVKESIHAVYPGAKIPMAIGFVQMFEGKFSAEAAKSFIWNGIDWTLPLLLSRLVWPAIGLLMLVLALLLFDRFERSGLTVKTKKTKSDIAVPLKRLSVQRDSGPALAYKDIPSVKHSVSIIPLIVAELKLGLKAIKPVWLLIGLAIVVGQLFTPFDIARSYLVPAAMIWPLVLWSSLGTRETRFNMRSLMYCSAGVHSRQYLAMLLSGVVIGLAVCSPMVLRAALSGEQIYFMQLISAALFIPTAAFALGVISGSRKLFEVIYLMIWYAGSIDQVKQIDLLGTEEASTSLTRIMLFALLTLGAAIIAYIARRRMAES